MVGGPKTRNLVVFTSLECQLQESGQIDLTKDEPDQLVDVFCLQDLGGVLVVLIGATLEAVHNFFGGRIDGLGKVFPLDLVLLALAIAVLHIFDVLWVHGVGSKVRQRLSLGKDCVDVLQQVGVWVI